LRVDSLPLIQASGDIEDWPHRLEWRTNAQSPWAELVPHNHAPGSVRMARLIRAAAGAAAIEDTATATLLIRPLFNNPVELKQIDNESGPRLRVVAISPQGETEVRWEAALVIVDNPVGDGLQMLTLSERRLTASGSPISSLETNLPSTEGPQ
jgi:hypothetical protein